MGMLLHQLLFQLIRTDHSSYMGSVGDNELGTY
jgi:hypothetical protein